MEEWWDRRSGRRRREAVVHVYICEPSHSPGFLLLQHLHPPEAIENASSFSVCSRNHEPWLPVSVCLLGAVPGCVKGGKGRALELTAALLTAGFSREQAAGAAQNHAEGKLSSCAPQCSNLLPFPLLFSHMGAPVVVNFSFQHGFASPYISFICGFCAVL